MWWRLFSVCVFVDVPDDLTWIRSAEEDVVIGEALSKYQPLELTKYVYMCMV